MGKLCLTSNKHISQCCLCKLDNGHHVHAHTIQECTVEKAATLSSFIVMNLSYNLNGCWWLFFTNT